MTASAGGGAAAPGAGTAPPRRAGRTLAGAAALIAALTVLARLAGFGRQLVFNATVGQTDLGSAYTTANYVPNIVFDVVAGGALAGLVVPVLAGPLARGLRQEASRTASALLTWTVVVLVPVTLVAVPLAGPVTGLLLGSQAGEPGARATATALLLAFLPQIPLYGLAVVSAGVLQAHGRFLAAAAAPLVSSLVVAAAYLVYGACFGTGPDDLADLPGGVTLVLGLGTTAGVLALALCTLIPLRGTGLRLRPALRLPPGTGPRVRSLAFAGAATLVAQQLATVVVLRLSNGHGGTGAAVAYQNAWMVYALPYAVLAVPLATSAFPRLAAAADAGDRARHAAVTAATTRAVVLVSCAGGALLAAAAWPVAWFFAAIGPDGGADPEVTALALVAFAPGLIGYGLVAHLGRALYALGRGRASAGAVVTGWAAVVAADLALVPFLPRDRAVTALGLGNSIGMTVAGLLLAAATARAAGRAALSGTGRVLAAGTTAAVCGGCAGVLATWGRTGGAGAALLATAVAAAAGGAVFAVCAAALGGPGVRAAAARVPVLSRVVPGAAPPPPAARATESEASGVEGRSR